MTKALRVFIITIAVLFFGAGLADTEAAIFIVTNGTDSDPGSLRQAILDANANADASNTIYFEGVSGTIALTTGQLHITKSLSIIGPGASTLSIYGSLLSGIFLIDPPGDSNVLISDLTIAGGNKCDEFGCGDGAGISAYYFNRLTLRNVVIEDNIAELGAGITSDAPLYLINSTVRNNSVQSIAGCVCSGGIYASSSLYIEGSTISGNSGAQLGGGIFVGGSGSREFTLINSTVSGNSAVTGGGIYAAFADVKLMNSTITGNTASSEHGGIHIGSNLPPNTLSITNTILSNNTVGPNTVNCGYVNMTPASGGGNIEDAATCGLNAAADRQNTDPVLGPFQNNGGLTMTYAPLLFPLSPAIDGGVSTGAPSTDQRGWPRPWGTSAVDSGAIEFTLPSLLTVGKGTSIGKGRVLSSPPGIDVGINYGSGSAYFPYNKRVNLTAIALGLSVFSGWSGTGCGDSVLMSSSKNCTATFDYCGTNPVMLEGFFSLTSSVISAAFSLFDTLLGQDIKVTASNRIEDLNLTASSGQVPIHGGYNCDFSSQIGYTYVSGVVTISGATGSVVLDRIIIL